MAILLVAENIRIKVFNGKSCNQSADHSYRTNYENNNIVQSTGRSRTLYRVPVRTPAVASLSVSLFVSTKPGLTVAFTFRAGISTRLIRFSANYITCWSIVTNKVDALGEGGLFNAVRAQVDRTANFVRSGPDNLSVVATHFPAVVVAVRIVVFLLDPALNGMCHTEHRRRGTHPDVFSNRRERGMNSACIFEVWVVFKYTVSGPGSSGHCQTLVPGHIQHVKSRWADF